MAYIQIDIGQEVLRCAQESYMILFRLRQKPQVVYELPDLDSFRLGFIHFVTRLYVKRIIEGCEIH